MKLLCIAFLAAQNMNQLSSIPAPESIVALAKSQIKSQFEKRHPNTQLLFDDPSCKQKGEYLFGSETLRLSAKQSLWDGEREYAISDLLDGRRVEFPMPDELPGSPNFLNRGIEQNPSTQVPNYIAGTLLGALSGGLGGVLMSPNAESCPLNGLVFALGGGLVGGLLSLAYESL